MNSAFIGIYQKEYGACPLPSWKFYYFTYLLTLKAQYELIIPHVSPMTEVEEGNPLLKVPIHERKYQGNTEI